ncbi:MAG: low molecular weight phosphotyrosine protein phosphatase [Balneolales bacterium]|nr:low molecular weight phosphotyrosine protein phosphatase [Balneolales bacterium]
MKQAGLEPFFYIDSAGTAAYHIGEPANSKSQQIANSHGVQLPSRARRFEHADFEEFDLVVAMDASNLRNLKELDRNDQFSHKMIMMRIFDSQPDDGNVPDPYYGGIQGFENVFQILDRSCDGLLDELKPQIQD